ncbi:MAG: hypothetical protein F6K55_18100 [Moorea sp. SIO4A3]|nr:hypothetical protein [Moorena sp. SIO4A3]
MVIFSALRYRASNPTDTKLRSKVQLSLPPISPSPYLPISLSPYLPISLSPYLPISLSPHLPIQLIYSL